MKRHRVTATADDTDNGENKVVVNHNRTPILPVVCWQVIAGFMQYSSDISAIKLINKSINNIHPCDLWKKWSRAHARDLIIDENCIEIAKLMKQIQNIECISMTYASIRHCMFLNQEREFGVVVPPTAVVFLQTTEGKRILTEEKLECYSASISYHTTMVEMRTRSSSGRVHTHSEEEVSKENLAIRGTYMDGMHLPTTILRCTADDDQMDDYVKAALKARNTYNYNYSVQFNNFVYVDDTTCIKCTVTECGIICTPEAAQKLKDNRPEIDNNI